MGDGGNDMLMGLAGDAASFEAIYGPQAITYVANTSASAGNSAFSLAIASIENEITFAVDYTPAPDARLQLMSSELNSSLFPESTAANHVWADLGYNPEAINIVSLTSDYFYDKIGFQTSISPDAINYVM
jgi:hypothetical protein